MCGYRLPVLLVIVFLLSPTATYTQTSLVQPSTSLSNTADWQFPSAQRYREISIYSGQTFANPQIMSDLGCQHVFLAGARLTGRLITTPHLYIRGNADVKPLALYYRDTGRGREYTYGGGGSVGLQFAPRREMRWLPYFDVDGGFQAFPHDIPLPDTRRVNMMIDFGPGLRIPMHGNNAIKTGVWFFHFSNGNTAPRNPGFDSFMAYAAYTYRNFWPHLRHNRVPAE